MYRLDEKEGSYWSVISSGWWQDKSWNGGRKVGMGCSGGLTVVGGLSSLFLFLGGGEANISGSIGPKSDSGGSLSNGEEGVSSICLDSVSKHMSASQIRIEGFGEIFSLVLWSNRG